MTGRLVDLGLSLNQKQRVTVEIDGDFREDFARLKDVGVDVEIREHREKRSLSANAYFWTLLGKLAPCLRTTPDELYLHYIRDFGVYRYWDLDPEDEAEFREMWSGQGIGWPVERVDLAPDGKVTVRAYYGSSQYDSGRMSALIDAVVSDCKEQGIETLTPDKLEAMKERWRPEKRG